MLRILGKTIVPVSVATDLGIYIDQSLTYNDHITKTVSTCLQTFMQIIKIKHFIDKNTLLLLLLSSLVFSKFITALLSGRIPANATSRNYS